MDNKNFSIWFNEKGFYSDIQKTAEELFRELNSGLRPKVTVLGVKTGDFQQPYETRLFPSDSDYTSKDFENLKETSEELKRNDKDPKPMFTVSFEPSSNEKDILNDRLKFLCKGIEATVKAKDKELGVVSYFYEIFRIKDFWVSIILQLNAEVINSYYSLKKLKAPDKISPVSTSLIHAIAKSYLSQCQETLMICSSYSSSTHYTENKQPLIMRKAGENLMGTVADASLRPEALESLFHHCNLISAKKYEGAESVGTILFSKKKHPNVQAELTFTSPVYLKDTGAVRKLLEISQNKLCLLSDGYMVYGFGNITGEYNEANENLFEVVFKKHYYWELRHNNKELMRVHYEKPSLPEKKIDEEEFTARLKRIFTNISSANIDKLLQLAIKATTQKHGTMLVITTEAETEAKRLENQCTRINPIQLTEDIIELVTAIDGAVLIDLNGTCYAIGVILDGVASKKGTSSRGARYNSAIRYVETNKSCFPSLAIVVSEDGPIDLIPDLRPQIPEKIIIEALVRLREIVKAEEINIKEFNHIRSLFEAIEFYLSAEICDEINKITKESANRRWQGQLVIQWRELAPNEDMDRSYFLQKEEK